jgi:hypothetical protein
VQASEGLPDGVTSFSLNIVPGAAVDEHVLCVTNASGLRCIYTKNTAGSAPIWLGAVGESDVKRVLIGGTTGGTVITKSGRVKICTPVSFGSTTATCREGPTALPDAVLEEVAGNADKGVGLTTSGTLVQWGQAAEAALPPAGTFRKIVSVQQTGLPLACAIATTDELRCWSLDATNQASTYSMIIGQKVSDAVLDGGSMITIALDGVVKQWPAGTVQEIPTYPRALDSCPLKPVTPARVCSEIVDYEQAAQADYSALCEAENGVFRKGESCGAVYPDAKIVYWCLGTEFDIKGKGVHGMAYFYAGIGCEQAKQACNSATGAGTRLNGCKTF